MALTWLIPAAISAASVGAQSALKPEEAVQVQKVSDWAKMAGAGAAPFYSDLLQGIATLAEQFGAQQVFDLAARAQSTGLLDKLIKQVANPSAALAAEKTSTPASTSALIDAFLKVRGSGMAPALNLLAKARGMVGPNKSAIQTGISPVYQAFTGSVEAFERARQEEQRRREQLLAMSNPQKP